jgi:type II secretory pathway pseudopilin PulG
MRFKPPTSPAFSVIELLVVIAVILLLAALLLPAISLAKTKSQRATCASNLHQIDLAIRMYTDDNKDTLPLLGPPSSVGDTVFIGFRPLVQSYLGLRSQPTSADKSFICPADTFFTEFGYSGPPYHESVHRGGPAYKSALTNFTSYIFNGFNTRTSPPCFGIAGSRLGSLKNPAKTVLVAEASAFEGFSWHKPQKEPLFRDSLNEVGFADGHIDFVKIFWNGSLSESGCAYHYDPPEGYAYTWSGK